MNGLFFVLAPYLLAVVPTGAPDREEPPPPLGSWARLYVAVIVLAIVMMFLLWLLTAMFNIRMPS